MGMKSSRGEFDFPAGGAKVLGDSGITGMMIDLRRAVRDLPLEADLT